MPLKLQELQAPHPILDFILEATFQPGERLSAGVRAKILLGLPHHCLFGAVDVEEASMDAEEQEALCLTGWIVILWTLSAILRCVNKLVLRESWAPENGERWIGKT